LFLYVIDGDGFSSFSPCPLVEKYIAQIASIFLLSKQQKLGMIPPLFHGEHKNTQLIALFMFFSNIIIILLANLD
jgi:hypothetical protein